MRSPFSQQLDPRRTAFGIALGIGLGIVPAVTAFIQGGIFVFIVLLPILIFLFAVAAGIGFVLGCTRLLPHLSKGWLVVGCIAPVLLSIPLTVTMQKASLSLTAKQFPIFPTHTAVEQHVRLIGSGGAGASITMMYTALAPLENVQQFYREQFPVYESLFDNGPDAKGDRFTDNGFLSDVSADLDFHATSPSQTDVTARIFKMNIFEVLLQRAIVRRTQGPSYGPLPIPN